MFRVLILVFVVLSYSFSGESVAYVVDVSAFGEAEEAYKASIEKKRVEDSLAVERLKKDPVAVPQVNVATRMVTIDPKSPEGIVIDQFDRDIASVRSRLYANVLYRKTAELDIDDQIKYMRWLLVNKYQDTTSVVRACESLRLICQIEAERLTVVRSVAKENSRGSIQAYIRRSWDCMGKLSALILEIGER